MRKEITNQNQGRADRLPATRRSRFLSPWFEDYWEPTRFIDDFFNRDFPLMSTDSRFLSPAIDVEETKDEYLVTADLPGINKEDIDIECIGNQLTITAERKYESTEKERRQGHQERFHGTYQRSFALPTSVDAEKISASYNNGVLTVHVPKVEQVKPRRIEIGESKERTRVSGNGSSPKDSERRH